MKHNLILCTLFLAIMGCKDDPEPALQLLVNTDMEAGATLPNGWSAWEKTGYTPEWTTEEASSGTRSLKISATQPDDTNFTFWSQYYGGSFPWERTLCFQLK